MIFQNLNTHQIQSLLIAIQQLFQLDQTGQYDEYTRSAVKNFQLRLAIPSTGLIDDPTLNAMLTRWPSLGKYIDPKVSIPIDREEDRSRIVTDLDATTDLSEISNDPTIEEYLLPSDEYIREKTPKKCIFIHHTAGWDNPFAVVDSWAADTRGRIGTHYVIGGINFKTGDNKYDGQIVNCIPEDYWAYHLGGYQSHGISPTMQRQSIGIEICNFGYLTKKSNGTFVTYTGQIVPTEYVCDLGYSFRGYQYWHKYTDLQLYSLEYLIKSLANKYDIDITKGLQERLLTETHADAFATYNDAITGRVFGILSHTSVRKDKTDCSPQPNLINLLTSL